MGYFVIGVSGVTCGGKTSLTKLLQRKLPWARVIHQDHYFYDDDWPHHVRSPEAEDHVNYEVFQSMDMEKMYGEVQKILDEPPVLLSPSKKSSSITPNQSNGTEELLGDKAETPNFSGGDLFLQQIKDIDVDLSKYSKSPILIIEGFTIFGSQFLFDKCHARFFCTLDKETCLARRTLRTYIPPDSPSYFEKVIWPEYEKHFNEFVDKRTGITVFDGNTPMEKIWKDSIQIVTCRMEESFEDGKFKDTRENLLI
jgi:nicotinamide/nicotinate riboside kinase